jgi:hypothetical protein
MDLSAAVAAEPSDPLDHAACGAQAARIGVGAICANPKSTIKRNANAHDDDLTHFAQSMRMFEIAGRIEAVMAETKRMFASRPVQCCVLSPDGRADSDVHAAVRNRADVRVVRAHH